MEHSEEYILEWNILLGEGALWNGALIRRCSEVALFAVKSSTDIWGMFEDSSTGDSQFYFSALTFPLKNMNNSYKLIFHSGRGHLCHEAQPEGRLDQHEVRLWENLEGYDSYLVIWPVLECQNFYPKPAVYSVSTYWDLRLNAWERQSILPY